MREGGIASTSTDSRETLNKAICTTTNMGAEFERSFPCLVKIYDSLESDLKLNDIFEFIGVLAFDTDLSKEKEDNNNVESSLCEDVLVELPPSKVTDLRNLLGLYADWHSPLLPYYSFDQFVPKVEKVGSSKRVKLSVTLEKMIWLLLGQF
ncbi:mini-chromosome maintenance complex-binding protein-like [Ipomoea triloba]|uniref:mini-chromosome maintenance complex-binding protein-like n=1 Tax=Ipomoea triloba TaxID=35885 RepID=UPI00125DA06E|nr:mini-chromosome maintenance complex-binding protein-like [Ipomoea triloba]